MKILYKDLLRFLNLKPSKREVSERLFQLGHEHIFDGDVFDIDITPNRGDCLSVYGLARDLKVFFGSSDTLKTYKEDIDELKIDFKNFSKEDCPAISFLEIEIDNIVSEYKPYLETYFSDLEINKNNLFTDISNFVSYELGQPTHVYDSEKIDGTIVFNNKEYDECFETLHGDEIFLEGKNSVFSVNNKPINLAGIMGSKSTSCSKRTKKVLVECAYFNPESIIGKSVKYNLNSDAAHKFERGTDILSHDMTLRRFVYILNDHVDIKNLRLQSFIMNEYNEISIPIDINKINNILGTNLDESLYVGYLKDIGFIVDDDVKVPSYRNDILSQNDLAEEIARVIGYNNIPSTKSNALKTNNNYPIKNISKLKNYLINKGFSEVINFPFTSLSDSNSIIIDNPIDSNKKNLRKDIKQSLIENLVYNERRQKDSIKLFEISDIYFKKTNIVQQKKLGIIASGRAGNDYENFSKKIDQDFLRSIFDNNFSDSLQIEELSRSKINSKRSEIIFYIEILVSDIKEDFYKSLDYKDKKVDFIKYKPISDFPSSFRDFSFSIIDSSKVDRVINYMSNINDDIIKDSFIFDYYANNKSNEVKVGFRLVFQSHLKTLSDDEVNEKVEDILGPILSLEGVTIPGFNLE
tara:strand:+ start:2843 stop:4750 length:1908 start_codon:yes stop_codon:yes gene_type:complete